MADVELKRAAGMAYREAAPDEPSGDPVLLVHGFPQSSYMWRHVIPALATAGRRVVAPDLPGYGDSELEPPGTWERHVEALERFRQALGLERLVLVNHDWGGWISMAWALDHSVPLSGLVISNTGFFPDGEWHGLGAALRTEGQGEALIDSISRDGLATMLGQMGSGFDPVAVDEYWKAYTSEERRRGMLELFRSGDLESSSPTPAGWVSSACRPWCCGARTTTSTPQWSGAHRFGREIPGARTVIVEGAGHFVWEDDPERCSTEVIAFLDGSG